ncbi:MAG: hypothetical protein ACXVA9_09145, partial [Bdellovibrionales bacterium]
KVIRDSFLIYKDKEPLVGLPPDLAAQTVIVPIDVYSGRFNGGNYPEVFRTAQPGVPRNTTTSLLKGDELSMAYNQQPAGDEDDDEIQDQDQMGPAYMPTQQGTQDAYQPGAMDDYELWSRRNRNVDNLFVNPFQGRY